MALAVARQERHVHPLDLGDHDRLAGRPPRRVETRLVHHLESGHLVQTRAADDSDLRFRGHCWTFTESRLVNCAPSHSSLPVSDCTRNTWSPKWAGMVTEPGRTPQGPTMV